MRYMVLLFSLLLATTQATAFTSTTCKSTRSELKALSCVVYYEARGASKLDKIATAFVALNRVDHPEFSNDLTKVVYKKHQFTWTRGSYSSLIPKNKKAWEESQRIASLVLNDEVSDPTNGQVYFGKHKMKYMRKVTLRTGVHYYGK